MDSLHLSSKLRRSVTYRRHRSFRYPISKPDLPSPNILNKDDSTVPTPNLNQDMTCLELNFSNIEKAPVIRPYRPNLCVNTSTAHKSLVISDPSPCKTEIPGNLSGRGLYTMNHLSPISQKSQLQLHSTFSKASEAYENGNLSPYIDPSDMNQFSARSGFHYKENSVEISAIVEENSISERNFPNESLDASEIAADHIEEKCVTVESIEPEIISMQSLQISNRNHSEFCPSPIVRKSLPLTLNVNTENLMMLKFEEALSIFNSIKLAYYSQQLWLKGLKELICCRVTDEMSEDSLELCEKLIIFAYSGFKQSDVYHCRLLATVADLLSIRCYKYENWTDIGFSSDTPIEGDLKHDVAALGLFQLLFMQRYLKDILTEIVRYCLETSMAFLLIAFDMSEISIMILRKKLLNVLINQSEKPLEVVFFLYAGCLIYWFNLHRSHQKVPGEINELVEKLALDQPSVLINLARQRWGEVE